MLLTRCTNSDTLQQWDHDASNVLFNVRHQICLDANLDSGSVVQVYWCNRASPGTNQQWLITPLLAGYFLQITDEGSAKCLDLDNAKTDPGTSVALWNCDANVPQHRWIYDIADGGIKYALNPGLCVDAPEAGESTGGRVSTWSCGGANPNQQFDIIAPEIGNGYTKGQLQLRNTKWCLQPQGAHAIVMAKCVPYAANQIFFIGTQLPATPGSTNPFGKCQNVECKNNGVCVNGACQCKDGWSDAMCGTKTDMMVGLETSDGYLMTVAGDAGRELTYDVPQSMQKTQQFLFNSLTKRLRVDERLYCVDGATANVSLAACSSAAAQQWVYDVTKGTVKQSAADVCLESAGGRIQASACAPVTKPGQVWLVDQNIFSGDKLIRHRSSLSSCMTVDNGTLSVKTCDLKHRVWRHDAVEGEAPLRVGSLCVQAVQRSASTGTLATATCDARADRNFEYDTATGLVRAFQTTLCVSLSATTLTLATCDAKDAAQHWYIARRDQCTESGFLTNMNSCGASEQRGQCAFSSCQCVAGYTGKRCEYETCGSTQCSNSGTCAKGKCTCTDGFAGAFCDDFVKCVGVACRNGGVCDASGTCACPVGFSGDKCQVRHPKVVLRTLAYRAIGVDGGRVVVVEPNTRNKDHLWWWDSAKNMLRSVGRPTYCLERSATGDVVLGTCDVTKQQQQQWRYEATTGRLRTGDQRGAVRFEQLAAGLRVVVLEDATSAPNGTATNVTILPDFRVDIDRLDLPGAPVRDDSGNCLTVSGAALAFRACDPNDDAQQWEYTPQNGLVRAALLDGSVCLAMNGASVGAKRCNGDDAAQKFRYDWATQRFRHRQSRQCVSGLAATACESAAPLHVFFRSFCDVVKLCGEGVCAFERCVCPASLGGPFCSRQRP